MIERNFFGMTDKNEIAYRYILSNENGMKIEVSDFGALVLSILIKDKNGIRKDVALGFQNIEDYFQTDTGMGAYVGRNANRIKGASVNIEGINYELEANDLKNNLHSGYNRSHCQIYSTKYGKSMCGEFIEFYRISKHLEQGFPGDLEQIIRYTLTDNNEFIIEYDMICDKSTVVNPTNHTYFNLDGHNSGTILEHELEVYSDAFLEIDKEMIPTGKIISVSGTPMNFRSRKKISKDFTSKYIQLQYAHGYDHNYIFENDRKLKKVAKLYSANSGITMNVSSDLCGLQIYTGNFLKGEKGKDGANYLKNSGICLETQFYPNSCNEKDFPSPILEAGKRFLSKTIYGFKVE